MRAIARFGLIFVLLVAVRGRALGAQDLDPALDFERAGLWRTEAALTKHFDESLLRCRDRWGAFRASGGGHRDRVGAEAQRGGRRGDGAVRRPIPSMVCDQVPLRLVGREGVFVLGAFGASDGTGDLSGGSRRQRGDAVSRLSLHLLPRRLDGMEAVAFRPRRLCALWRAGGVGPRGGRRLPCQGVLVASPSGDGPRPRCDATRCRRPRSGRERGSRLSLSRATAGDAAFPVGRPEPRRSGDAWRQAGPWRPSSTSPTARPRARFPTTIRVSRPVR